MLIYKRKTAGKLLYFHSHFLYGRRLYQYQCVNTMNLKITVVILSFFGLSMAGYAPVHGGHSNTFRKQDDHGNYAFGYDIVDHVGAKNFRKESGDAHGNKVGSYGLHDVDGRLRIVDYVADAHGFRAKIRTNEPGTANKDAAAAIYNGPDHAGYSHSHIPAGKVAPQYNHGGYGGGYGGAHHGGGYEIGPLHGGYSHHAPYIVPFYGYQNKY